MAKPLLRQETINDLTNILKYNFENLLVLFTTNFSSFELKVLNQLIIYKELRFVSENDSILAIQKLEKLLVC